MRTCVAYDTKIRDGRSTLVDKKVIGNRTDWSPIRSVIIRVITKSDDQFVYHEYDNRPNINWTTQSLITN